MLDTTIPKIDKESENSVRLDVGKVNTENDSYGRRDGARNAEPSNRSAGFSIFESLLPFYRRLLIHLPRLIPKVLSILVSSVFHST